jgi:hypothetical protein
MTNIKELLYGVANYAEFSMKLKIIGYPVPARWIFDVCHPDDWKWETLCTIMNDLVDKDMETYEVDRLIEKAFNIE